MKKIITIVILIFSLNSFSENKTYTSSVQIVPFAGSVKIIASDINGKLYQTAIDPDVFDELISFNDTLRVNGNIATNFLVDSLYNVILGITGDYVPYENATKTIDLNGQDLEHVGKLNVNSNATFQQDIYADYLETYSRRDTISARIKAALPWEGSWVGLSIGSTLGQYEQKSAIIFERDNDTPLDTRGRMHFALDTINDQHPVNLGDSKMVLDRDKFIIGRTADSTGHKLQVFGSGYFSDTVSVLGAPLDSFNIVRLKELTSGNFSPIFDSIFLKNGDTISSNKPLVLVSDDELTLKLENDTLTFNSSNLPRKDSLTNTFTGSIEAVSLIVTDKTNDDILLGDGTTTSLSSKISFSDTIRGNGSIATNFFVDSLVNTIVGSLWTDEGDGNISYQIGNVGIGGESSAAYDLAVTGSSLFTGDMIVGGALTGTNRLEVSTSDVGANAISAYSLYGYAGLFNGHVKITSPCGVGGSCISIDPHLEILKNNTTDTDVTLLKVENDLIVKDTLTTISNLKVGDGEIIERSGTMSEKDFWSGTQAQYDALGSYDSNTLYFIND